MSIERPARRIPGNDGAGLGSDTKQPRLITLEAWLAATYGSGVPSVNTARRWVREGRIWPPPEKHGRAYYLKSDARYIDPANPPTDLEPTGRAYPLIAKAGFGPAASNAKSRRYKGHA